MKRFQLIFVSVVFLLVASCSSAPSNQALQNSNSASPHIETPAPSMPGPQNGYQKETLVFYSYQDTYGAIHEDGYYFMDYSNPEGHANIKYLDFTTMQEIFLCGKPNCAHHDSSCTSYVKESGSAIQPFVAGGRLHLLYRGARMYTYEEYGEECVARVVACDLNGENRETLFKLEPGVELRGLLTDGKSIYSIAMVVEDEEENFSYSQTLVAFDLETGTKSTLEELGGDDSFLRGAYGDEIYYETCIPREGAETLSDFTIQVNTYNVKTGEGKTVAERENISAKAYLDGHMLYNINPDTLAVSVHNLATGEENTVCERFTREETEYYYIQEAYDGLLQVAYVVPDDEWGTTKHVLVNCSTGEVQPQPLVYAKDEYMQLPVTRLGKWQENYLVLNGWSVEYDEVHQTAIEVREVAFISVTDYWEAAASYKVFTAVN